MDEPTATLTAGDHERLFEIIRDLASDGVTIVYVSHFLEEVLALVDDVTVLKDGALVRTAPAREETARSLVRAMVGRDVPIEHPGQGGRGRARRGRALRPRARPEGRLRGHLVRRPRGRDPRARRTRRSGRSEVARAIFGADRIDAGSVHLDGKALSVRQPRDAVRAGIAMLPESRKDQGLLMRRPIRENVSLPHLHRLSNGPFVNVRRERAAVAQVAGQVDIRARSLAAPVRSLSGGNQQKTLFAKWLMGIAEGADRGRADARRRRGREGGDP